MSFVSGALMEPISKDFVRSIHRFIDEHDLDLVHFRKDQRNDDVAHEHLAGHDGSDASSSSDGPKRRRGSTAPKSASILFYAAGATPASRSTAVTLPRLAS